MKKLLPLLLLLWAAPFLSEAQNSYTISGKITDSLRKETLPLATILVKETNQSTQTDFDGNYSIILPQGSYTLEFLFLGYTTKTRKVTLNKNLVLNIPLKEDVAELEETVIIVEKPSTNVEAVQMSTTKIEMAEMKKQPAFMGEVDVIKSIQTLPGVTSVGEGANGFNVRGGNIDQNLVLMDLIPIYSSSHLFGFFSVFNADVVESVELYKGGIPSLYGGRVSSVLDVQQRTGSKEKLGFSGGIGTVSSRLAVEGPLDKKKKSSFLLTGRRSYADLFLKFDPELKDNIAYFYDLNAKLNYRIDENNIIYGSGYLGRDVWKIGGQFGFNWGNTGGSLRWYHAFSDSSFMNISTTASNYSYELEAENIINWQSIIRDYGVNADFTLKRGENTFQYGLQTHIYDFSPARVNFLGDLGAAVNDIIVPDLNGLEISPYFSHERPIGERWSVRYGLRYSGFWALGPREVRTYEEGVPKSPETLVSAEKVNGVVIGYNGLDAFEPRLAVKFSLDSNSSIKMGYNRMRQYLHLIGNSSNGLPLDVWKSADTHVKPLVANQIGLGYFRNFKDNTIEASAEVFYKDFRDIVEYKNGADLLTNEMLETDLLSGIGRAYGLELLVRKTKGRFTGWVAYTLSRSERKVAGDSPEETINGGEWYVSNFDKTHDLTIIGTYELSPRLSLSANFVYSTGRPYTPPSGTYEYEDFVISDYTGRNNDRISDYHRLDLAATLKGKKKEGRRWQGEWVFSIYNAYARRNAYSYSFSASEEDPNRTEVTRISILGTILPAITYNFTF